MRLIVCGGRDFEDRERAFRALDAAHAKRPITTVVHGSALGADWLAGAWAVTRRIAVQMFVPDGDRNDEAARPMHKPEDGRCRRRRSDRVSWRPRHR